MRGLVYLLMSISVPNLKREYCTIVELFDTENTATLKSGLYGSLNVTENGTVPYIAYKLLLIVTMALSCIISEIKRDIGRKLVCCKFRQTATGSGCTGACRCPGTMVCQLN